MARTEEAGVIFVGNKPCSDATCWHAYQIWKKGHCVLLVSRARRLRRAEGRAAALPSARRERLARKTSVLPRFLTEVCLNALCLWSPLSFHPSALA